MVTQPTETTPTTPTPPTGPPTQGQPSLEGAEAMPLYPTDIGHVDDLLSRSLEELEAMYATAVCPEVRALDGQGQGRMLAVTSWGAQFPLSRLLPALAGGHYFPWKGKNFTPISETRGEGINRTLSHRWPLQLFRFETSIAHSLYDGAPAFVLNYDLPSNPGLIRRIRDEIRQISPDVFLGQAWLRYQEDHFALYFGIQFP